MVVMRTNSRILHVGVCDSKSALIVGGCGQNPAVQRAALLTLYL